MGELILHPDPATRVKFDGRSTVELYLIFALRCTSLPAKLQTNMMLGNKQPLYCFWSLTKFASSLSLTHMTA